MMTIVDDLVSVDSLIEDYFYTEPANEFIQSCDIVAFNKICKFLGKFGAFSLDFQITETNGLIEYAKL